MAAAASLWSPLVILDLETTGLPKEDSEVIQIAACTESLPVSSFKAFIVPSRDIPAAVTELTGFAKTGGVLTLRGVPVEAVTRAAAVRGLLHFLRYVRDADGGQLVLVAHNAFGFDADLLLRLFAAERQTAPLAELVRGFADTLPLFRAALPDRARKGLKGAFTLGSLAKDFGVLDSPGALHNADYDVDVLRRLIGKVGVEVQQLVEAAKPLNEFSAFKEAPKGQGRPSDGGTAEELRSQLAVLIALEKAARKMQVELPKLVQSAGWTTHAITLELDKEEELDIAKDELQSALDGNMAGHASAMRIADEVVSESEHMGYFMQLVREKGGTWTMELQRGGVCWKGSFPVNAYAEAGHPALYLLLRDDVLRKQNSPRPRGSQLVAWMDELQAAAMDIQPAMEYHAANLSSSRNRRDEDLLLAEVQQVGGTRRAVERAMSNTENADKSRNAVKEARQTVEELQYIADWLDLIGDDETTVHMEVRRGDNVCTGKQAMKELDVTTRVLLFDVMRCHEVKRQ